MMTKRAVQWFLPALASLLLTGAPQAQDIEAVSGLAPAEKEAISELIHDYLLANPEVLIQSLQLYEERKAEIEAEQQLLAVITEREKLQNDPNSPVIGNPGGDVVVVEFFDYQCPYCIEVAPLIRDAVKTDGNIRLVMKEFPILGPDSMTAARMALASVKQGKYEEFHFALMAATGGLDAEKAFKVAENIGLDVAQLRRDLQSPEIDSMLQQNYTLAETLGISGTPFFVIGDEVVSGALTIDTLRQIVAGLRGGSS
jgi:protein-disulfide isomerase